jgi:hypothetical protein
MRHERPLLITGATRPYRWCGETMRLSSGLGNLRQVSPPSRENPPARGRHLIQFPNKFRSLTYGAVHHSGRIVTFGRHEVVLGIGYYGKGVEVSGASCARLGGLRSRVQVGAQIVPRDAGLALYVEHALSGHPFFFPAQYRAFVYAEARAQVLKRHSGIAGQPKSAEVA